MNSERIARKALITLLVIGGIAAFASGAIPRILYLIFVALLFV